MSKHIALEGNDHTPLMTFNQWQIAGNFKNQQSYVGKLKHIGRHNTTQEVFILLEGQCYIATAGIGDIPAALEIHTLSKGELFIVEVGEWHAAMVFEYSKVLIVEDADTLDSESMPLSKEQIKYLEEIYHVCVK